MEFSELLLKRQSDRKYALRPVAREHILKCLEAARMAPSACNSQPWKFIVVDSPDLLKEMSDAAAHLPRLARCPYTSEDKEASGGNVLLEQLRVGTQRSFSKYSLPTPQAGHTQSSGMS